MKIDWKQKLSSRKLWAAVVAAILAVVTAMFGEEMGAELAEIVKTGVYALMVYIFGESAVDIARQLAKEDTKSDAELPSGNDDAE